MEPRVRALCSERIPQAFADALTELERRARDGDARARQWAAESRDARAAVRVMFEGETGGELYMSAEGGVIAAHDAPPADTPVVAAVALPAAAAEAGLQVLMPAGHVAFEKPQPELARLVSSSALAMLQREKYRFHLILREVPGADEVVIRIALGESEPPAHPAFTMVARYDDLEDAHERAMNPQQMLMAGKLQILGDSGMAMQLALNVAQLTQG